MNFDPGVYIILLNRIFAVFLVRRFCADITFLFQLVPSAVILVLSCLTFSGHTSQHIWAYVTFLVAGICCLWIQWHIISAFYLLGSISIFSYALEEPSKFVGSKFFQTSLNLGCLIRCRYSSFCRVSSSRTELAYISCIIVGSSHCALRWYHVDWRCSAAFAKPPVKGTCSFSIR